MKEEKNGFGEVIKFSIEYPLLNLKLANENEKSYKIRLATARATELYKGFKVKHIGKITNRGTKVTYVKLESFDKDFNLEMKKIREYLNLYEQK